MNGVDQVTEERILSSDHEEDGQNGDLVLIHRMVAVLHALVHQVKFERVFDAVHRMLRAEIIAISLETNEISIRLLKLDARFGE